MNQDQYTTFYKDTYLINLKKTIYEYKSYHYYYKNIEIVIIVDIVKKWHNNSSKSYQKK